MVERSEYPETALSVLSPQAQRQVGRVVKAALAIGVAALVADGIGGWGMVRLWLQLALALAGAGLLALAWRGGAIGGPRRLLWALGGALTLLSSLSSLAGAGRELPAQVFLLGMLSLGFPDRALTLWQGRRPLGGRTRALAALLAAAGAGYLAAACAVAYQHYAVAPVTEGMSRLTALGFIVLWLARLGTQGPLAHDGSAISGPVRACPACGMRNIAERRMCKRCHAPLGDAEPGAPA